MASEVSIMRMFGLGLTLAVLMDATLVRMLLVPAFMHLMGPRNWWAPEGMARWHGRFGLRECGRVAPARRPLGGRHRMPGIPARAWR
jgi:RND superfamily putative drug exporter